MGKDKSKWRSRSRRMVEGLIALGVILPFAMQARTLSGLMSTRTTDRRLNALQENYGAEVEDLVSPLRSILWNDLLLRPAAHLNAVSDVHCVGENFLGTERDSLRHKSCSFRHLCYDFTQQDFIVTASERFVALESLIEGQANRTFSSTVLSPPWAQEERTQWFPRRDDSRNSMYYQLPDDVVMVPFLPTSPDKMLHVMWDFLLPIFTLLSNFHLEDHRIALVDVSSDAQNPLLDEKNSIVQFFPLLRMTSPTVYTFQNRTGSVDRICARQATAAMSLLESVKERSPTMRLQGRGRTLWDFRQYMLQNIGVTNMGGGPRSPFKVTLVGSKLTNETVVSIRQAFAKDDRVEVFHYASIDGLSLEKRVKVALESSVFVSDGNDESSAYGIFVPRGGSIVLLTDQEQSSDEWEYVWSHLSHVRVHELSNNGTDEFLVKLIQDEIRAVCVRRNSSLKRRSVDAYLGDWPLTFVNSTPQSYIHCIDEGNMDGKGKCNMPGDKCSKRIEFARVCEYRNLCFDTANHDFVIPRSEDQEKLENLVTAQMRISSAVSNKTVFIGGRNEHERHNAFNPQLVGSSLASKGYYELDPDMVWLFTRPVIRNLGNPGHMMWDTILPFYAQLSLFQHEHMNLAPINFNPDCRPQSPDRDKKCSHNLWKYLPLLGASNYSTLAGLNLTGIANGAPPSGLVCARIGLAGTPMLTDTGFNTHGQRRQDYLIPHNVNRGRTLWEFQQFMLQRLRVRPRVRPKAVTFSIHSSNSPNRNRSFQNHITALSRATENTDVSVRSFQFADWEMKDQIEIVNESSIYVSTAGGSSAIATFLPRGSSLILFYNDIDELKAFGPSYLDWDFWNNAEYLRVHWLPISTMDDDVDIFVALVQYELEVQKRL